MPTNFALLDSTLPDVARLLIAMVQARDAVESRSWSHPQEPTTEEWWARVAFLSDPNVFDEVAKAGLRKHLQLACATWRKCDAETDPRRERLKYYRDSAWLRRSWIGVRDAGGRQLRKLLRHSGACARKRLN
jgi:hypothetical protein